MKYVLLALAALCVIGACKKTETPKTKAQQLRDAANWEPNSLTMTYYDWQGGDSDMVIKWEKKSTVKGNEGNDSRPECLKDDKLQFKEINDGDYITSGTKCVSSETDDIAFKWGLTNNDKNMYIYGLYSLLGGDANGLLTELTDDKFVFTYPGQVKDAASHDIPVKYVMTFTKK